MQIQSTTTVFNSFELLITTFLVAWKAWFREKFSDHNNCMFFLAIVSQKKKILQSFYVAEKAGEQGKKCKALCPQLVFHDMGGLLLKASKVFIY